MSDNNPNRALKGCLQLARSAGQHPCQSAVDADQLIAKITDALERAQIELGHAKAFGEATAGSLELTRKDLEQAEAKIDALEDEWYSPAHIDAVQKRTIDQQRKLIEYFESERELLWEVRDDLMDQIIDFKRTLKTIQKQSGDWYQGATDDGAAFVMKSIWDQCNEALGLIVVQGLDHGN